jgi:hypothetical protein
MTTFKSPADHPNAEPRFPTAIVQKNRLYLRRSELEIYKCGLLAAALGVAPVSPQKVDPDHLVPLKAVCAELGLGRRTIGRRIAEAKAAAVA